MQIRFVEQVSYREMDNYFLEKGIDLENEFDRRYYNTAGHSYSAYTVLNYILDCYNKAVAKSTTSFTIMNARFTTEAYERVCNLMLPFFKEVKDIHLQVSPHNPDMLEMVIVEEDALNVVDWARLSGASPVKQRLLRLES